ncbi:hypothetical protein C2S52_007129 [Perilla frutescens var. hirtella]|nr:hypothetical protein C2S52_007129 [Perilla frutescens var. hirtella]
MPPPEIALSPSQATSAEATTAPFLHRTHHTSTAAASDPSGILKHRRVISPSPTVAPPSAPEVPPSPSSTVSTEATATPPTSPPPRAPTPPSPRTVPGPHRSWLHSERLETSPPAVTTRRRTKPP